MRVGNIINQTFSGIGRTISNIIKGDDLKNKIESGNQDALPPHRSSF